MQSITLEWIKVLGSILISWPIVGLVAIILFRKPLLKLIEQFTSGNLRRARIGPFEIERELNKLAEEGKLAVSNLNRMNELMAESRLLELEITDKMFGVLLTNEQRQRLNSHIEELRRLTGNAKEETTNENVRK